MAVARVPRAPLCQRRGNSFFLLPIPAPLLQSLLQSLSSHHLSSLCKHLLKRMSLFPLHRRGNRGLGGHLTSDVISSWSYIWIQFYPSAKFLFPYDTGEKEPILVLHILYSPCHAQQSSVSAQSINEAPDVTKESRGGNLASSYLPPFPWLLFWKSGSRGLLTSLGRISQRKE